MKRNIKAGIVLALLIGGSIPVFAHAVGLQLVAAPDASGAGYGPALTFKLNSTPFIFGVDFSVHGNDLSLGATADKWMIHELITDDLPVMWGLGWGVYGHLGMSKETSVSFGGRFPVFIDAFFRDGTLEPFLQIAPSVGIAVAPVLDFPDWSIPVSIGLRYWFDEP